MSMEKKSKTIKGLGIAVIAMSSIPLVFWVVIDALFIVMLGSPTNLSARYVEVIAAEFGYVGTFEGAKALAVFWMNVLYAIMFLLIAIAALTLAVGIMSVKWHGDRSKMNKLFGWSLAAAILNGVAGGVVLLALLIILAVTVSGCRGVQAPNAA